MASISKLVFSEIFGQTKTVIRQEKISSLLAGKTYSEIVHWYTKENIGAVMGLIRKGEALLAPEASLKLQETDLLVILTQTNT